jgi:hypothetical protein
VIEVLERNHPIVEAFFVCRIEENGVSAAEVRAAVALLRIPAQLWRRVLQGVQLMAREFIKAQPKGNG